MARIDFELDTRITVADRINLDLGILHPAFADHIAVDTIDLDPNFLASFVHQ
jgi:hypothetical protein